MLSQIYPTDFSAVYYPDGAGAFWDLQHDGTSQALIHQMLELRRPCGFVGHGAAALLQLPGSGNSLLISGRRLTAPARVDEAAVCLPADAASLEQAFSMSGAFYSYDQDGAAYLVRDGGMITGQNAEASLLVAREILAAAS